MATDALVSVGIDLSLSVSENLALVQEDLAPLLAQRGAEVRWVPAAQLHVALKLVGRVERSLIPRVRDKLSAVVGAIDPFEFAVEGVEVFPDGSCPRQLLGRVGEGREQLEELAARVDAALAELGLAQERRPYRPDVLLGRLRTPQERVDLSDVVAALGELPLGRSLVRDATLLESHLTPKGSQLQVLARSLLRGVVPQGQRLRTAPPPPSSSSSSAPAGDEEGGGPQEVDEEFAGPDAEDG